MNIFSRFLTCNPTPGVISSATVHHFYQQSSKLQQNCCLLSGELACGLMFWQIGTSVRNRLFSTFCLVSHILQLLQCDSFAIDSCNTGSCLIHHYSSKDFVSTNDCSSTDDSINQEDFL